MLVSHNYTMDTCFAKQANARSESHEAYLNMQIANVSIDTTPKRTDDTTYHKPA